MKILQAQLYKLGFKLLKRSTDLVEIRYPRIIPFVFNFVYKKIEKQIRLV